MKAKRILAAIATGLMIWGVLPALAEDQGPPHPPGESAQVYSDPLAPFNEKMFWFNLKLDHYFLHPVAEGYAFVAPTPVREAVGRFFNNVNFIPRFANNLFQLRVADAGGELARFGINTTVGVAGLFDPADHWFGLKESRNDMGLTLGHYGISQGPYLVLPFLGPSTIRDTVGYAADEAMWPLPYFVPWYISLPTDAGKGVVEAVNFRSLHLDLFEQVDRYAVDLYGAVQDGYLQRRANQLQKLSQ
ncbi:MAG: VacJ family lipoprotein [Candidatus Binataceae bacterium]